MLKKTCIIFPFFGEKWPIYFDVFLKSCYSNPVIDFIFFSNIPSPSNHPNNVYFHSFSLSQLSELINEKLNLNITIKNAYKLCDMKPSYGLVFNNFIKEYEYWGFGDIDIIYGDIEKYINPYFNYDIISFRPKWISGAFTLLKNDKKINSLFMKSTSWKQVFLNEKHYSFDECFNYLQRVRSGEDILEIDKEQSFTYLAVEAMKEGSLKVVFLDDLRESIPKESYIEISPKKVFEKSTNREYLLYHYISEKKKDIFDFPKWDTIPDHFYIDSTGFYLTDQFKGTKHQLIKGKRKLIGVYKWFYRKSKRGLEIILNGKR